MKPVTFQPSDEAVIAARHCMMQQQRAWVEQTDALPQVMDDAQAFEEIRRMLAAAYAADNIVDLPDAEQPASPELLELVGLFQQQQHQLRRCTLLIAAAMLYAGDFRTNAVSIARDLLTVIDSEAQ